MVKRERYKKKGKNFIATDQIKLIDTDKVYCRSKLIIGISHLRTLKSKLTLFLMYRRCKDFNKKFNILTHTPHLHFNIFATPSFTKCITFNARAFFLRRTLCAYFKFVLYLSKLISSLWKKFQPKTKFQFWNSISCVQGEEGEGSLKLKFLHFFPLS